MSRKRWKPYFVTLAIVSAIALFKYWFNATFMFDSPNLLFFSAVTLSAWNGGVRQGIFAILIALAISNGILAHQHRPENYTLLSLYRNTFFIVDCLLIVGVCSAFRRSQRRAESLAQKALEAESVLRKSEQRFRRVFDSNMIGLLFSDKSGRIIDANDYFLQRVHYTRAELESQQLDWKKLTPPEFLEKSLHAGDVVHTYGRVEPFEKAYVTREGETIPVLIGSAAVDSSTNVTFVLDIADRKRAEKELFEAKDRLEERVLQRTEQLSRANEALRQSQHFLDSVIENIPNMIFIKDAKDLRFVRFNRAGEDLLGYPRNELLGKNDFDFFPREEAEAFTRKDREVLADSKVEVIAEEPLTTRTGVRYLSTKKIPLFNRLGEPQYLLGISEDITEKKAAELQRLRLIQEQAARAEAEKTAQRLSFLSEVSVALQQSLDIARLSQSVSQMMVQSLGDLCVIEMRDADTDPEHTWSWRHAEPDRLLERAAREVLDGTEDRLGVTSESFSFIRLPLQTFGPSFGTLVFISASDSFTEADLSLAEDLAKRLSISFENARLVVRAQEANQAKTAFLANMSHEIRTPLGAILGFAELISYEGSLSRELREYLATIIRNGEDLLRIVDEILDISKVESDRIQIETIPFSLHQLILDVNALLSIKAQDKNLRLEQEGLDEVPAFVLSDPTRLRQILINIVGNAIKFTSEGRVTVSVKAEHRGDDHLTLLFTICDTGIGISPEQSRHLFEPFSQAESSTNRRFGGTGLGLFLSKKLANLLGGDLILKESTPGQGSCFELSIQALVAHPRPDQPLPGEDRFQLN